MTERSSTSTGMSILVSAVGTVIGGIVLAVLLWLIPWLRLAIVSGTIPPISAVDEPIRPFVTWSGRVDSAVEYRRPSVFSDFSDQIDCYKIHLHNAGQAPALDTTVVINPNYDAEHIYAFGDFQWRAPNGNWVPLGTGGLSLTSRNNPIELRIPLLHPDASAEIHVWFQRPIGAEWEWPPTSVMYDRGPASLTADLDESEWRDSKAP